MKFIKYGLFFSVILVLLAGCSNGNAAEGNKSKGGGEIRVAVPSEPPTLDTHMNTTTISSNIGRNIFETLLRWTLISEIQPMLAESCEESKDGKTIDFKLRKGVKFHNGEEMKAPDVVASMNRWIKLSSSGKIHLKAQHLRKLMSILFNWKWHNQHQLHYLFSLIQAENLQV